MKKLVDKVIFGQNSIVSGLIALAVVAAIGLGCFCNKDKFSSLSNSSSPTPAATFSPSPSATREVRKIDASKGAVPSNDETQTLVKNTLLDFNDSLQKEDFTGFYNSIAKFWQKQTSPDKLKNSFQEFIDGDANLSGISSMTANFTRGPVITNSLGMKTLEVDGEYATSPIPTTFLMKYINEKGEWKCVGIEVHTKITKRP